MQPRIQYAQTEDGVSIAYHTIGGGEGTPVIEMPLMPWSHIQMQHQLPDWERYSNGLSEKRLVVRYDGRGSGMSDRKVTDFSLDSLVCDLEAVVAAVGLERFALIASLFTGPVGIAYAARHPEQLSHLLLWCTYASGRDYADLPAVKAFQALRKQDWEIYTQTGAHAFLGWAAATKALECAIATQTAFAEHNESAEEPIQVRIGLEAGEPIAEEDDLFGTAVITAARITAKAQGGEILTSDTVRGLVAGKNFLFADRGDVALRGFEDPVKLWELRWRES